MIRDRYSRMKYIFLINNFVPKKKSDHSKRVDVNYFSALGTYCNRAKTKVFSELNFYQYLGKINKN